MLFQLVNGVYHFYVIGIHNISWSKKLILFYIICQRCVQCLGLPEIIRIGGLFDDSESSSIEAAFRYAIYRINNDHTLLDNTKLSFDIQHLPSANSFLAARGACNQARLGVAAIFGPRSPQLANHINSMCHNLEIPHIEARIDPRPDANHMLSINLFPDRHQLSQAYIDLIRHFKWTKFCVLYAQESDLLLLQDVIRAPTFADRDVTIYVRQIRPEILRETLKDLDKRGVNKYIAHLDTDQTYQLLQAALQLGMIDPLHHFILTNLDLETIALEDFQHNFVNLTGLRLINRDRGYVHDLLQQMCIYENLTLTPDNPFRILNTTGVIKAEAALMFDAVHVLVFGLRSVNISSALRLVNLTCEQDQAWAFGSSLYNYLNLVEMEGLTGKIKFHQGRRIDFELDILQLDSKGLQKIGVWNPTNKITITYDDAWQGSNGFLPNTTLKITTILEPPYVMHKKSEQTLIGNDRYEGFCVDLLWEIAKIVGFKYEFILVPDGMYGIPDKKTGEWDGMIREILDGRADLAVASLTINLIREQVMDFTKPFMNLGISILFKRPKRESPGLFSFLNPLAIEIWLYVIAAYLLVSMVLFIVARFSPYEWYNPHPCNPETDVVENVFTLSNSFWFAVGTLMQQGSDINPKAVSTRIVGGIWWFFTLIIISSYTANLAAFLTVERMVYTIENAEDLASQNRISYGTIMGGSTMTFFMESKIPTYQRMWNFMDNKEPSVFVKTSKEGIDRVLKGDYAFLMESTMIDYNVQRHCDLMQVGGLLDSKGYGIGTPKDSPYRDKISMAILTLQEGGKIQMLYNKWWKNSGTCNHEDKKQDSKASSLDVENIGGIFVVLFVGLAMAIVSAVIEFLWNSRKNARSDRQSLWSEMLEELKFAVRCHGSTKKPALTRHCSKCARYSSADHCAVESPNGCMSLKNLDHYSNRSPVILNHRHRESPMRYQRENERAYRGYHYQDHIDAR